MNGKRELNVVAAALVDESSGSLLLARRPEGKNLAGMWEYPGGKIEAGETPREALARELKEELNLNVSRGDMISFAKTVFEYETFVLRMELFVCKRWTGEPTPTEGQRIAWVNLKTVGTDAENYPMPPADDVLSERLRNDLSD